MNVNNNPLHTAVNQADLETIKNLIQSKADVNQKDERGYLPLHNVFRSTYSNFGMNHGQSNKKFVKITKLLLENKTDLHASFPRDDSLLKFAAGKNYKKRQDKKEIIQLLLESKAPIDKKQDFPLFTWAIDRKINKISKPLENYFNGVTLSENLVHSYKNYQINYFNTLLKKEAYEKRIYNELLIDAVKNDKQSFILSLLPYSNQKLRENLFGKLLFKEASEDFLMHFLNDSFNPNFKQNTLPLLLLAIKKNKKTIVKKLFTLGADPLVLDINKRNALYFAEPSLLKLLVDKGVDIDHRDRNGETALQIACKMKKIDFDKIEALFKLGLSCKSQRILFSAVREEKIEIIKYMLPLMNRNEIGAFLSLALNVNASDEMIALFSEKNFYPDAIVEVKGTQYPLLFTATVAKRVDIVNKLIEKKVDINVNDESGNHALFYANYEISEKLIEANIDINHSNRYGETALMNAIEDKNEEKVQLLKSKGAKEKPTLIQKIKQSWYST